MAELIPEGIDGDFSIKHRFIGGERLRLDKLRDILYRKSEFRGVSDGIYCILQDNRKSEVVMSDTQMEKTTNAKFLSEAKGDVMIAGLGIGMILFPLCEKEEIKSVTIYEKEASVLNLILPHLKSLEKINVIPGDIFTLEDSKTYDTIYFDIWNNICGDNYDEMLVLHEKFKNNLRIKGWMGSWRYDDCYRLNDNTEADNTCWSCGEEIYEMLGDESYSNEDGDTFCCEDCLLECEEDEDED